MNRREALFAGLAGVVALVRPRESGTSEPQYIEPLTPTDPLCEFPQRFNALVHEHNKRVVVSRATITYYG